MKLEIVVIPVSDVDRAKRFYGDLGWRLDADFHGSPDYRVVQLTPPGSACSVIFGIGVSSATPGSVQGLHLVTADIDAARADLAARGAEVSDVQDLDWGRFVFFADPDGNKWALQQLLPRG
jgi:catechol 2,3-dioxygenase-like lactoylglutathione lyase family enzyme